MTESKVETQDCPHGNAEGLRLRNIVGSDTADEDDVSVWLILWLQSNLSYKWETSWQTWLLNFENLEREPNFLFYLSFLPFILFFSEIIHFWSRLKIGIIFKEFCWKTENIPPSTPKFWKDRSGVAPCSEKNATQ